MSSVAFDARRTASTQIVARRVDVRQAFARKQSVASVGPKHQRLASGVLIVSSLAGVALTLVGHL